MTESPSTDSPPAPPGLRFALMISALGIVFGDLGTSPLYTLQECLGPHGVRATEPDVMGILSLIFWSLVLVVTVKYVVFLMRADNRGEGGILALLSLVPTELRSPGVGKIGVVAIMAVVGAALLFGDGIITPAISVLSAVEGMRDASPALSPAVIPVTVAILVVLFLIQSHGTGGLGRLFGPVMLVWFLTAGVLGAIHLAYKPAVLWALLPTHAVAFFARHGWQGAKLLGGVVLAVTGCEALYADMGHFGRLPIRRAWLAVCLPMLVLCYFGQGAVLIDHPDRASSPFYAMCPQGVWLYPFVLLATFATIIASQALISGVFSLVHQGILLGYFPRVAVLHTSDESEGQIYIPSMNYGLAIACILLVLIFQKSDNLAAAFGLAVSGTMLLTSLCFVVVARVNWRWNPFGAYGVLLLFLFTDVPFVAANSLKFFDGGYIPFVVATGFATVMILWHIGRSLLGDYYRQSGQNLDEFVESMPQNVNYRTPGIAIAMASSQGSVPPALLQCVRRFGCLHETIILLHVRIEHVPRVADRDRVSYNLLKNGFHDATIRFGFTESTNVHALIGRVLQNIEGTANDRPMIYLVGRETITPSPKGRLGLWTETIFAYLQRNSRSATDFFSLPPEQVLEIGGQVDL